MTSVDHPQPVLQSRLLVGLGAFLIVLIIGALAGSIFNYRFKSRIIQAAQKDASIISSAVARSLAGQFEKAARFGIQLNLIPGIDDHLKKTMAAMPTVKSIALYDQDRKPISTVGSQSGAPIIADAAFKYNDRIVGSVRVFADSSILAMKFDRIWWDTVLLTLLAALAAGFAAVILAGRTLARDQVRLITELDKIQRGEFGIQEPGNIELLLLARKDVVSNTFRALENSRLDALRDRQAFKTYAEDILAVDFEDTLRKQIETIRQETLAFGDSGMTGRDS